MKILSLKFKNLNSLYGEWSINFEDEQYSDGIFAITGRTGAGKSTILDAICLALYGRTPRLATISNSTNEIISKNCIDCYSEVTFQTKSGVYTANWSQKRAKGSGKLQNAKHIVFDFDGNIIEEKLSRTQVFICEVTGMDFGRFTQSVMLAQGKFDEFLKSKGDVKAEILEQITGTKIYAIISQHVYERNKAENEALANLNDSLSDIAILSEDEEAELKDTINQQEAQKVTIDKEFEIVRLAIDWHMRIAELQKNKEQAEASLKQINHDILDFSKDKIRLSAAQKARGLAVEYETLKNIRIKVADASKEIAKLNSDIIGLQASLKTAEVAKYTADSDYKYALASQKDGNDLIVQVELLDAEITNLKKAINDKQQELDVIIGKNKINQKDFDNAQAEFEQLSAKISEIENYLAQNAQDENIGAVIGTIKTNYDNLNRETERAAKESDKLKEIQARHKKLHSDLENKVTSKANLAKTLEAKQSEVKDFENEIKILLNGSKPKDLEDKYNILNDNRIMATKIKNFEAERAKLEDGKECPVCGAIHHPYALGNIPKLDEIEQQFKELQKVLGQLKTLQESRENIAKNADKIANEIVIADNDIASIRANIADLELRIEAQQQECEACLRDVENFKSALAIALEGVGQKADLSKNNEVKSAISTLELRSNGFNQKQEQFKKFNQKISELKPIIASLKTNIANNEETIAKNQGLLDIDAKNLDAKEQERLEIFGTKDTKDEAIRLTQELEEANQKRDLSVKKYDALNNDIKVNKERLLKCQENYKISTEQNDAKSKEFAQNLETKGFANEAQFAQSAMPESEIELLENHEKTLNQRLTEASTLQKNSDEQLVKELKKHLTDDDLETCRQKYSDVENQSKEIFAQLVDIKGRLKANNDNRQKFVEKTKMIAAQEKECAKWGKLNNLIGSATGKTYRIFVQGLTFEIMIHYANQQLSKMSERYLLQRNLDDNSKPLELNVIDNYQGGVVRPVSNLSGGESFIVSLALALGLSKMASNKISVDSLFLDEGFGTLDEDALESALETLSRLQEGGKLIGIISHVGALKEKIRTQINVTPLTGGRSKLSGAGVM